MKVYALDLSLHAGFAKMLGERSGEKPQLVQQGTIHYSGTESRKVDYPWSYDRMTAEHVNGIMFHIDEFSPDVIIVEETNGAKNRYTQKLLEFLHLQLIQRCRHRYVLFYIDSSEWRSNLGLQMTKEQKKANAKLRAAMRAAKKVGKKVDKKKLGVAGLVNKKHVAIHHVEQVYGLKLKVKENDAADAICLGLAYFNNAKPSDGV